MGENIFGQLGDGTFNNTNLPEKLVPGGVLQVAGGFLHSLFIKSDGSLWSMGYNYFGQLGIGVTPTNFPYGISYRALIVHGSKPQISKLGVHGADLQLDCANGLAGATNCVLVSQDPALPYSQWSPIKTNVLNTNGDYSLVISNGFDANVTKRFFVLQRQ